MRKETKEVILKYKYDLEKYVKTGECKPQDGVNFWLDIAQAYRDETGDRITADKAKLGSCGSCRGKVIKHLYRLYEREESERERTRTNKTNTTTQPKKGRGRPSTKNKPTN